MSAQCLLLSLYEGLLWRENLRRRSKEACSCFAVKVTGENKLKMEGNLSYMWVGMAGHSSHLVEKGYKKGRICSKSSAFIH